jgi:endonuclease/exonuclease/phosphatase family metal-dependent hydrolase
MTGDLNTKQRDWNARLTTASGSLLCDDAKRNSCLVYGPNSPTTNPYNFNATPDILDIVVMKDFALPAHMALCLALSSDHLPVLIDTKCL